MYIYIYTDRHKDIHRQIDGQTDRLTDRDRENKLLGGWGMDKLEGKAGRDIEETGKPTVIMSPLTCSLVKIHTIINIKDPTQLIRDDTPAPRRQDNVKLVPAAFHHYPPPDAPYSRLLEACKGLPASLLINLLRWYTALHA